MTTGEATLQQSIPVDRTVDAKRTFEAVVAASRTTLTPRQSRVLDMLSIGFTYEEIGARLELSRNRVWQIAKVARRLITNRIVDISERHEDALLALVAREYAELQRVQNEEEIREQLLAHEHFARTMRAKEMAHVAIVTRAHTLFHQLDFHRREQLRLNGGQRTFR